MPFFSIITQHGLSLTMSLWEILVPFSRGSTCWARPPPKDFFLFFSLPFLSLSEFLHLDPPRLPLHKYLSLACSLPFFSFEIYCNIHFWLFSFPCLTLDASDIFFFPFLRCRNNYEKIQELLNSWAWFRVISGQVKHALFNPADSDECLALKKNGISSCWKGEFCWKIDLCH